LIRARSAILVSTSLRALPRRRSEEQRQLDVPRLAAHRMVYVLGVLPDFVRP
jgi:hypothetical protein